MHHTQLSIDSTGTPALLPASPHNPPLSPAPSSPAPSPIIRPDLRSPHTNSEHSGSNPSDSPLRVGSGGLALLPVQHTSSFTGSEAPAAPALPAKQLQLPAARISAGPDSSAHSAGNPALRRLDSDDGQLGLVLVSNGGGSPVSLKIRRAARAHAEGEVHMEPEIAIGEQTGASGAGAQPDPQTQTLAVPQSGVDAHSLEQSAPPPAAFSTTLPRFEDLPGLRTASPQDCLAIPMPLPLPVSPLPQGHMGRVGSPSVGGSVLFYPSSPSPRVRYSTYGETRKRPSKVTAARSGAAFGAGHLVSCCLFLLGTTLLVLSVVYQSFYWRRLCDSSLNRCSEQRIGLLKICTAVASPANGPYSEETCDPLSAAPDYGSNPGFQLVSKQFALLVSAAALALVAGLLSGLRGLCKRCPSRSPLSRYSALFANLCAVVAVTLGLCGVLLHGEAAVELGSQHSACAGSAGLCSVSVRLGWVCTVAFVALAVVIGAWVTLTASSAAVIATQRQDGHEGAVKFA